VCSNKGVVIVYNNANKQIVTQKASIYFGEKRVNGKLVNDYRLKDVCVFVFKNTILNFVGKFKEEMDMKSPETMEFITSYDVLFENSGNEQMSLGDIFTKLTQFQENQEKKNPLQTTMESQIQLQKNQGEYQQQQNQYPKQQQQHLQQQQQHLQQQQLQRSQYQDQQEQERKSFATYPLTREATSIATTRMALPVAPTSPWGLGPLIAPTPPRGLVPPNASIGFNPYRPMPPPVAPLRGGRGSHSKSNKRKLTQRRSNKRKYKKNKKTRRSRR
jgi:hypothetical protein